MLSSTAASALARPSCGIEASSAATSIQLGRRSHVTRTGEPLANFHPSGRHEAMLHVSCHSISAPLYSGGQADVYRADSPVALKVMRPKGSPEKIKERLFRELCIWQELKHPHILPLYGTFCGGWDLPALVSPWCKNGNICEYLAAHNGEPDVESRKLRFLREICEGLHYLHTLPSPIVHGDLKGANILISDQDTVQLGDFGFASIQDDFGDAAPSSATHGTLRWMAPELLTPAVTRHTKETDIWAYGCVIIEVCSGKPPFHDIENAQAVIVAVAGGKMPSRPETISDGLWDIAKGCFATDPGERWTLEAIKAALLELR